MVVALFVGALLGYASARAIDALGWRFQRQAAARLARAEIRRLRGLLGPAGAPGDPAAGGAVLELLAAASGLPVRLHSAVERLLRRDGGLFADDALVLLLRLEDALRALEAELDRVWQTAMADAADEALRAPGATRDGGLFADEALVLLLRLEDALRALEAELDRVWQTAMADAADEALRAPGRDGGHRDGAPRGAGQVAGHIAPAAPAPGRAAAVRCLRAAQEVRAILDALEVAIAPPPGWRTRVRLRLASAARGSARVLRQRVAADLAADARTASSSELSA